MIDVGDQPGRADELGRNAAGDDLLLLDDLGVEVGAERAGDRVGHVDAVEVVDVVGRDADVAADVAVVHARPRGRVARLLRIVGHHARHQLQVALIAAAGRQRLGQLQRDVLAGRRARRVDERRLGGHLNLLGHSADRERDAEGRGLSPDRTSTFSMRWVETRKVVVTM